MKFILTTLHHVSQMFFFRYKIKHIFKKELFLIMLWDLMCNISTDGTSINELEISTGQHTLDKGIINNTSLQFAVYAQKVSFHNLPMMKSFV